MAEAPSQTSSSAIPSRTSTRLSVKAESVSIAATFSSLPCEKLSTPRTV